MQEADEAFPEILYRLAGPTHFWMEWRVRAFLAQLRTLRVDVAAPLRVLDVGAGIGALRAQLEPLTGWTIDIAEPNPAARGRYLPGRGDAWLYDVAEASPDRIGRYDAVLLFDVIEHVEEPIALLRDAAAHLRDGGRVFVNVPALPRFYSGYDRAQGHRRRYTRRTLRGELEQAGLGVLEIRYWGFSLLPMLVARWAAQRGEPRDAAERERWIRSGFEPASRATDAALRALARLETRWLTRAPAGTSLLGAAEATASSS